jgi:hypothetical protein
VAERIRLGVEDQVDIALAQQADALGAMLAGLDEAQALQPVRELGAEAFIHGELEKLDAVVLAGLGRLEQDVEVGRRSGFLLQALTGFLFQVQQRTQAIGGIGPWRRGAEAVVEDLQRQRPGVTALDDRREEARQIELALPGKQRKCRLHSSTSMARIGASAICTKKILSPGYRRWRLDRP